MVLMISYDLNGNERPKAYEVVRKFIEENATSWARPLKSQWFVETRMSPHWWVAELMKLIDADDLLFVCRIPSDKMAYQGFLSKEIWDWLNPRI